MATQSRELYLISLLSETLPTHLITQELLDELEIAEDESFGVIQVIFSNQLQNSIETKDATIVADWKSALHEEFILPFRAPFIKSISFLNLSPFTRTLIFSLSKKNEALLEQHTQDWFNTVCQTLKTYELGTIIAFSSRKTSNFLEMGKLYKDLRRLGDYRYVLGMGTITFFEDWHMVDTYSLTEYKYISEYEVLLGQENWIKLTNLITTLYEYLKNHAIKDSKLIYVYKELVSITIRYLYSNETAHLSNIERLNGIIIDFGQEFNDLEDVHAFMLDLILVLSNHGHDMTKQQPHIRKVLKWIHKYYSEPITLSAIADELSLSEAYISRLFKSDMQMSFKEYLTKYRLDQVKEMLVHTDLTIGEIAGKCGYQDPNQLTRIFKKYEKTTPRNYRQQNKSTGFIS